MKIQFYLKFRNLADEIFQVYTKELDVPDALIAAGCTLVVHAAQHKLVMKEYSLVWTDRDGAIIERHWPDGLDMIVAADIQQDGSWTLVSA